MYISELSEVQSTVSVAPYALPCNLFLLGCLVPSLPCSGLAMLCKYNISTKSNYLILCVNPFWEMSTTGVRSEPPAQSFKMCFFMFDFC